MKSALAALLLSLSPTSPTEQPVKCHECQVSEDGVLQVKTFEGYSPFIYKDIAGYPTIGHGHLIVKGESFKQPLLPEDAEKLLIKDMAKSQSAVNKLVLVDLWQSQFDALNSFTFNLGSGTLKKSSVLRYVNANRHKEVPARMMLYVKADGKTSRGLELRRAAEGQLYMKDEIASQSSK